VPVKMNAVNFDSVFGYLKQGQEIVSPANIPSSISKLYLNPLQIPVFLDHITQQIKTAC
jgi:hypothetical protein